MAWEGYFQYAGQEFINVERTAAYAQNAGAGWFKNCYETQALSPMLGEVYRTPLLDEAPWTDPDQPDSYDFWGVYPVSVTGIEDSTRSAEVIESILDGGRVGRVRHGTRAIVFSVLLLGSPCGVEYGMRWLKRLLLGVACGTQASEACAGDDLCYLSCEPCLDFCDPSSTYLDAVGCMQPYLRSIRETVINNGPSVSAKNILSDGSAIWTVQFTATAGNPWEFGMEIPIVENFGVVPQPYVSDIHGTINLNGPIVDDSGCVTPVYQPVFNPACAAYLVPPTVPSVPLGCYKPPLSWKRIQFTVPEEYIPLWSDVVPLIKITGTDPLHPVTNLRLRFYADVDGDGDITDDKCAYCGDIVVSYVPIGETIVLDGSEEQVYVEAPNGGKRRADSLVFATDGTPFKWPVLSCGFGYVITIDREQSAKIPSVDFSLYPRAV